MSVQFLAQVDRRSADCMRLTCVAMARQQRSGAGCLGTSALRSDYPELSLEGYGVARLDE